MINEHEIDVYALIKKYDKSGDNHIDNQEFWKILNKVDDTLTI